MRNLKLPTTNTQEVLYTLIKRGHASLNDFSFSGSFRSRISNLRLDLGLNLIKKMTTRCNKHGNPTTFAIHFLPKEEKDKAINIYKKLTKD